MTLFVCLLVLIAGISSLQAQSASGTIQGTVVGQNGQPIQGAHIAILSASQVERTLVSGADGKYSASGLPAGTYSVQISATGFATEMSHNVTVAPEAVASVPVTLSIASVSQEVTVEAEADSSLASQLSPVKSVLDAGSARTEITSQYVSQFTTPVTDFSDLTQAVPGTVSWSPNGIGNGQAKTYFRGFKDGMYTMTWDGVPFQDSNDPTHHSWAYVPAPAIGYVDVDRSPGTASDIGPTNFAGSIHYFSPRLSDQMTFKAAESFGSFNTNMFLGQISSGLFLHGKANFWLEGHHQTSDGYQTFNYQQRTAGSAKFTYKFSDRTYLAITGTFVIVDSNTPNNDPSRAQLAQFGDNFLLQNNQFNSDGSYNGLYYRYYTYHVPTNFEVITFTKDFGKSWRLETKPYTYSYSNHQHYNNTQASGSTASPSVSSNSAINKLNQYNRGGDITTVSDTTRYGVFRIGAWYEYTSTHRYQVGTDPRTWIDSAALKDLKFHEYFKTNSAQPFVEFQLVAIPRLTLTAGVKSALYTMDLEQLADGKTVGNLGCPSTTIAGCAGYSAKHSAYYNNILPSVEANVRLQHNWSVYGQYGEGSVIPPSAVFDTTGAQVAVTPKPTVAGTIQGGTVVKLNRLSFDADAFHIHYDSAYSSFTPSSGPNAGFTYWYPNPPMNTNGFEAEGNAVLGRGVSLFMNGTVGTAKYEAAAAQAATSTSPAVAASPEAWVALAPHDTESLGLTYQDKGVDFGFFNKRIGSRWEDVGSFHQNIPLDPFWISNLFFNYTIRKGSRFDQSKIKLSVNNLFDNHDMADISPANKVTASLVPYTPSAADTLQLLPGRSIMITFELSFSPKER